MVGSRQPYPLCKRQPPTFHLQTYPALFYVQTPPLLTEYGSEIRSWPSTKTILHWTRRASWARSAESYIYHPPYDPQYHWPSVGKRRRGAGSKETSEPIRQSPRLRCRSAEGKPQPSRESPRLRERRDLTRQQAGKPGRSSPRTAGTHRDKKEERRVPTCKSATVQKNC